VWSQKLAAKTQLHATGFRQLEICWSAKAYTGFLDPQVPGEFELKLGRSRFA